MKRELLVAVVIAWVVVIARSAVFLFFSHAHFDSDQAIVGLMAKHLAEGRAFPLFYYGLTYMLGVDAWMAAPFFLVAGPTVFALRLSLIFANLATATVLIVGLWRWCGLRPFHGLVASLFFTCAPPFTSALLVEAGGNIGPLFYVLLLWITRDRPLWFGAILAIGFLHREFTMYAAPVLLAGQLVGGTLVRADRIRMWLVAGATFLGVWQAIETLKPFADLMGPGTRGQLVDGAAGSQVTNILNRAEIVPVDMPHRAWVVATDFVPRLLGGRFVDSSVASQGHDWVLWPLAVVLVAATMRALVLVRVGRLERTQGSPAFGWYLLGVGVVAAVAYALARPATGVVNRYLLLTLFIPIGAGVAFLAIEPRIWLRRAMVTLVLMWAALSALDHGRLAARYISDPGQDEMQVLADELAARGIHVAASGYWRAYKLSFLSRERVKVASTDIVRIDEYQRLADREGNRLIVILDEPCPGEQVARVGGWFLCRGR